MILHHTLVSASFLLLYNSSSCTIIRSASCVLQNQYIREQTFIMLQTILNNSIVEHFKNINCHKNAVI